MPFFFANKPLSKFLRPIFPLDVVSKYGFARPPFSLMATSKPDFAPTFLACHFYHQ